MNVGTDVRDASQARTLEDFFITRGMALQLDQAERLAAGRRQRRLDTVPDQLRPAVADFTEACMRAHGPGRPDGSANVRSGYGWVRA